MATAVPVHLTGLCTKALATAVVLQSHRQIQSAAIPSRLQLTQSEVTGIFVKAASGITEASKAKPGVAAQTADINFQQFLVGVFMIADKMFGAEYVPRG